jgi:hypothetical protein
LLTARAHGEMAEGERVGAFVAYDGERGVEQLFASAGLG